MPIPSPIPNTRQRKKIYVGTETTRGTAVTPTYKWYGDLVVTKETPIVDRDEYAGTYDVDYTPTFDPPRVDGTYAVPLSYQDLAILSRYGIKGAVSGVTDGNSTPGYTYAYSPTAATDDLDSATLLFNFDGIIFRSTGALFNEFTIRGNIDDAGAQWMWDGRLFLRNRDLQVAVDETTATGGSTSTVVKTGAAWVVNTFAGQYVQIMSGTGGPIGEVGLILSNTADTLTISGLFSSAVNNTNTFEISSEFTAGITDRTRDPINMAGTRLFLEDVGGTLGTVQQRELKAFSINVQNDINPKRFAEDLTDYSSKIDRGLRRITAQVTIEFSTWRELARWEEHANRPMRIDQVNGPLIDSTVPTRMYAQIDVPSLQWFRQDEEVRNNNILATFKGRGYVNSGAGYSFRVTSKTASATLP